VFCLEAQMFFVNQRLDVLKHAIYVCCVAGHGVIHLWAGTAVGVTT
jgi:hypothetical protein